MSIFSVDSISLLRNDLRRRLIAPVRSVTFYCHLLLGIVVGGGLGIWYTIGAFINNGKFDSATCATAIFTYYPALVAAALLEFIQEKQPYMRSFGILSMALFAVLFFSILLIPPWAQIALSIVASFLAILYWWIANGEKSFFRDVNPDNSIGDDVNNPLLESTDPDWHK